MPAAALFHQRHGALRGEQERARVDVHRPVPAGDLLLQRGAVEAGSGVVDEDIQPIKLGRDRVKEQVDIFDLGQVGRTTSARRPISRTWRRLLRRGPVAVVVDHHIRAGSRQAQRDRPANPAPRPGDQGHFARQKVVERSVPRSVHVGHPFPPSIGIIG